MPLNAIKNYVKEELPGIYEAGKFIRDRAEDFNENREQVFEGVQQQVDGKDSTQINEEVREIGSEAVLNGEPVFWSGQNYGWQSKGSFDKLMDEGQFRMGGIAAQRIGNSITEAIPQEVKDFATEKITDAANAAVDFYQDQDYETQQRINVGLNIANGVVTLADQGLEFISEKTNTSRFITDELAMAALTAGGSAAVRRATPAIKQGAKTAIKAIDKYGPTIDNIFPPTPPAALATAGSAPPMQLNVSGGKANLQVMEAVTATNPRVLEPVGVKTGASMYDETGAQGKQFINRTKNIEDYKLSISIKNNEMTTLRELRGDPKNLKTFIDNSSADLQKYWKSEKGDVDKIIYRLSEQKKTAQEALSQAESNVLPFVSPKEAERIQDFKNVNYFRKKIGLEAKAAEQTARKIKGFLEQHHLFPKGMSAAYFGKMDELIEKGLATKDDLILMAEFAAVKGRRAGDIKANLLNMQRTPHNRMHTELRAMGAELNKTDYQRLLKDVDNVDDLLDRWADLFEPGIEGDAVYNAAVAELWEPMDELLKKISSDFTGTAKSKKVPNK